jgi:ferredoxin
MLLTGGERGQLGKQIVADHTPNATLFGNDCQRSLGLNHCIMKARGENMPQLTVDGFGTFAVPEGKRLVLALTDEAGVDQLHACGGNCRCTTCRVEFVAGEPERMTQAEKEKLAERGLSGVRLSCQILCDQDMTVRAISRLEGSGRPDPGSRPEPEIHPEPVWGESK